MSFSFDFHAPTDAVSALLDTHGGAKHAPQCVKDFIRQAVSGLPHDIVHVKADGHLFNKDYQVSSCKIEVTPVTVLDKA